MVVHKSGRGTADGILPITRVHLQGGPIRIHIKGPSRADPTCSSMGIVLGSSSFTTARNPLHASSSPQGGLLDTTPASSVKHTTAMVDVLLARYARHMHLPREFSHEPW